MYIFVVPDTLKIINNKEKNRFETGVDGDFAYIDYRFAGDDIVLMHTFTPLAARGKGISSALAKFVLDYCKENSLNVVVYCPFLRNYIKLHPEYSQSMKIRYKV